MHARQTFFHAATPSARQFNWRRGSFFPIKKRGFDPVTYHLAGGVYNGYPAVAIFNQAILFILFPSQDNTPRGYFLVSMSANS
jgi:hypothetical protein